MIAEIPDPEGLKAILGAPGAPPYIVLDIGGSADLNGDGFVRASLAENGELIVMDA